MHLAQAQQQEGGGGGGEGGLKENEESGDDNIEASVSSKEHTDGEEKDSGV